MDFTIGKLDNLPVIQTFLQNSDDTYIDLTNASGVSFVYFPKSRVGNPITGTATRLGDTSGYVQFQFPNTVSGGYWYGKFVVNYSGAGGRISFPNSSHLLFCISENLN